MAESVLILACGALARELAAIRRLNGWDDVRILGLPQRLHAVPAEIPGAVREVLERERVRHSRIFVAYADCGTLGELDRVIADYGAERLPGAHCYAAYCGEAEFARLAAEQPGSFYLTDFLVRHFERLVVHGLGLDRRPELLPHYFGHYRRVVYLSQSGSAALRERARAYAARLGLGFVERPTGLAALEHALGPLRRDATATLQEST